MKLTRLMTIALVLPVALEAQDVTGRLAGRVVDQAGPRANVEITVTGPSLMGRRSTITASDGGFLVPGLPPGSYRIVLRSVGARPISIEQVPILLGTTTTLPRILVHDASVVELSELTVTARDLGLETSVTASRTTADLATLEALPLERSVGQAILLLPSAAPSFLGDGINVAGGTGLENNFFIDGINVTSPLNGATGIELPFNFVEQLDVRLGGAEADGPLSIGGAVNIVTPPGGNALRGQLFAFYSADALQAEPRPLAGSSESGFRSWDIGASAGGALVRDRLWFFAAWNPTRAVREYRYAFGPIADTRWQHLLAGKLSWLAGPRTRLALTVLGDPSNYHGVRPPVFASGQTPLGRDVLAVTGRQGALAAALRLETELSRDVVVEATLAHLRRHDTRYAASPAGREPAFLDLPLGTMSGGNGHTEDLRSSRSSAAAAITLHRRRHVLRAGAQLDRIWADLRFEGARDNGGGFVMRTASSSYTWFEFRSRGRLINNHPALFLQDVWQVSGRLRLLAGLRWSRQMLVNDYSDSLAHEISDGLQPRLAVIVTPGRAGTQRVWASYARVADQIAMWSAQFYGSGLYCSTDYSQDPRVDTTGGVPSPFCSSGYQGPAGDERVRGLVSDDLSLGYERQLGSGISVAARLLRRSLRSVLEDGFDSTGTLYFGNPGAGSLAAYPRARRTYEALELVVRNRSLQISYTLSRSRGNYTGLFASDLRVPTAHSGPQFDFAEQLVNGFGPLPNDRRHLLKAFAVRQVADRLVLGASLLVASGTPLSEYGGVPQGSPYVGFSRARGSAGRTPAIWDAGARLTYRLPMRQGRAARVLLDVQHIGSPRRAVDYDQVRFTCTANDASCTSASYGRVTAYQPPMTGRLGLLFDF